MQDSRYTRKTFHPNNFIIHYCIKEKQFCLRKFRIELNEGMSLLKFKELYIKVNFIFNAKANFSMNKIVPFTVE